MRPGDFQPHLLIPAHQHKRQCKHRYCLIEADSSYLQQQGKSSGKSCHLALASHYSVLQVTEATAFSTQHLHSCTPGRLPVVSQGSSKFPVYVPPKNPKWPQRVALTDCATASSLCQG